MDNMRGMMSRAQDVGTSLQGIRDGASAGSGPSGLLGDPPHVEGRARVSTRVRGTASDGGGDGEGLSLPPSFATAIRGREQVSPGAPGPPGGREQAVPSQEQGPYDVQARSSRPVGLPIHPDKSVGLALRKGPSKGMLFRRPYGIQWMRSLACYMNGCPSWRHPSGPPDGQGAVVAD